MPAQEIATALKRVETVLRRRPETGMHDDAAATARWEGGLRVISSHANGTEVATDMPAELGGSGDRVSPGWLLRAGFASCTATCIAMAAAAKGIALEALEVRAGSRSDTRGLLGMADAEGEPVYAGPQEMQLHVRIAAPGVAAARLRALVEESYRCSPMACVVQDARAVALSIDLGTG
ncbi:MAG: OsmC family protein [Caldimonas sp.]